MIKTLLSINGLNQYVKISTVREKKRKENFKNTLESLDQDTFERSKNIAFKGKKSKTLGDIDAKLNVHRLKHGLKNKYVKIINEAFQENDPIDDPMTDGFFQAENLVVKIAKLGNPNINNKLKKEVIIPLLADPNEAKASRGIEIVKDLAQQQEDYAMQNIDILDPLISKEMLVKKPNLARSAIEAIGEIGANQIIVATQSFEKIERTLPLVCANPEILSTALNNLEGVVKSYDKLPEDLLDRNWEMLKFFRESEDINQKEAAIKGLGILGENKNFAQDCFDILNAEIMSDEKNPVLISAAVKAASTIAETYKPVKECMKNNREIFSRQYNIAKQNRNNQGVFNKAIDALKSLYPIYKGDSDFENLYNDTMKFFAKRHPGGPSGS